MDALGQNRGLGLTLTETVQEIGDTLFTEWPESFLYTALYMIPFAGTAIKVVDWISRLCNGVFGLKSEASKGRLLEFSSQMEKRARVITREKQAQDVLYIVANLLNLLFFSTIVSPTFELVAAALAPTLACAVVMLALAQRNYQQLIKEAR